MHYHLFVIQLILLGFVFLFVELQTILEIGWIVVILNRDQNNLFRPKFMIKFLYFEAGSKGRDNEQWLVVLIRDQRITN